MVSLPTAGGPPGTIRTASSAKWAAILAASLLAQSAFHWVSLSWMALTSASWVLGDGAGVGLQAVTLHATARVAQSAARRFIFVPILVSRFSKPGPFCGSGRLRGFQR